MPQIAFTPNLERYLSLPQGEAPGRTVRELLDGVFAANPSLRGYVVDEQGQLRQHVTVFVDGEAVKDRAGLSDALGEASEVYVMQALSGG